MNSMWLGGAGWSPDVDDTLRGEAGYKFKHSTFNVQRPSVDDLGTKLLLQQPFI